MTQAFNLSQLANNLNTSGQLDATDGLVGSVPVANGGTGAATLAANNVLLGNGTSALQAVAPSTSGNVLQSNGTTWTSAAIALFSGAGGQAFTGNGTFTIPTGITKLTVTVVGGGASGASNQDGASGGGAGGAAIKYLTGLTSGATLAVTIGAGGAAKGTGGGTGNAGGSSTVASGTQTITTLTGSGGVGGNLSLIHI